MLALTQSPAAAFSDGTLIVSRPAVKAALTPPLFESLSWDTSLIGETGVSDGCEAVAEAVQLAFGDLGLHRVEASTLLHNVASQRVLARNGFEQYGTAPRYLQIAGRWQDHLLFARLKDDPQP